MTKVIANRRAHRASVRKRWPKLWTIGGALAVSMALWVGLFLLVQNIVAG